MIDDDYKPQVPPQLSPVKHDEDNNKEVPVQQQPQPIVIPTDQLYVSFNQQNETFIIYGSKYYNFSVKQIIKYLTREISDQFLSYVSLDSSQQAIEAFIGNAVVINNSVKVSLLDQDQSPFMGNFEMLITLYKHLNLFKKEQLQLELSRTEISIKTKQNILRAINEFIYHLLYHIIKLITLMRDMVEDNSDLKERLLDYTIIFTNTLTQLIKDEINQSMDNYKNIQLDLVKLGNAKLEILERISDLEENIKVQKRKLDSLIFNLPNKNEPEIIGLSDDKEKIEFNDNLNYFSDGGVYSDDGAKEIRPVISKYSLSPVKE